MFIMKDCYLIIDSSSGSIRANLVSTEGQLLATSARSINNKPDPLYESALYFDFPEYDELLITVCREVVASVDEAHILAVSAASQTAPVSRTAPISTVTACARTNHFQHPLPNKYCAQRPPYSPQPSTVAMAKQQRLTATKNT